MFAGPNPTGMIATLAFVAVAITSTLPAALLPALSATQTNLPSGVIATADAIPAVWMVFVTVLVAVSITNTLFPETGR
jgi:hypothetical protein